MNKTSIHDLITAKEKRIQCLKIEKEKLEKEIKLLEERSHDAFLSWLGKYNSSLSLGIITSVYEELNMKKDYIFLTENNSEYYTTKKIVGIDLRSNWNDGTNGTITLLVKDDINIIKCMSQPFRGHDWNLKIFFES